MSFFHLFMTIRQQSQAWKKEVVPKRIHIHAPFGNPPGRLESDHRASHCGTRLRESARAAALVPVWMRPDPSVENA